MMLVSSVAVSHPICVPRFGDKIQIIADNVASYKSAKYLLEGDVKCGSGICTIRQVTGCGMPQLTAISEVYTIIREFAAKPVFTSQTSPMVAS